MTTDAKPRVRWRYPVSLAYEDELHRYCLDGEWLPSVSAIIRASGDPEASPYYEGSTAARDRGVLVHAVIEKAVREHPETPRQWKDLSLCERETRCCEGYFLTWRDFLRTTGFEPVWCETALASRHFRFAGRVDLLGYVHTGDRRRWWLIDVKSGSQSVRLHSIQLAAYDALVRAHREALGLAVSEIDEPVVPLILYLKGDSWKLRPIDLPSAYCQFQRMLHHFFEKQEKER